MAAYKKSYIRRLDMCIVSDKSLSDTLMYFCDRLLLCLQT
jgi:hypothetical protein